LGLSSDLDELLDLIVNETRSVLQCDRASLFLYDARTNELYSKIAHGISEIRVPADQGVAGACAQARRTVNVPDAYADPRFNPAVDRKSGYQTRSILSCPLIDYDGELVGVVQAINKAAGPFTAADEWLLETLSSQAAVALQRSRLIQAFAEKQRLERELTLAREIQQRMLPRRLPELAHYDLYGWSQPADQAGGDCYNFIPLAGDRLAVVLADASGHGIGPALVVTQLQAMLRVRLKEADADHGRVLQAINEVLCEDLPSGRFVTAFCGVLDPADHRLAYCSAGQGPIIHVSPRRGKVEMVGSTNCPLGIVREQHYHFETVLELAAGDMVLLLTDGFYEWRNRSGEQFGAQRLAEIARHSTHVTSERMVELIRASVSEFAAGTAQEDDLTAVVVKRRE